MHPVCRGSLIDLRWSYVNYGGFLLRKIAKIVKFDVKSSDLNTEVCCSCGRRKLSISGLNLRLVGLLKAVYIHKASELMCQPKGC